MEREWVGGGRRRVLCLSGKGGLGWRQEWIRAMLASGKEALNGQASLRNASICTFSSRRCAEDHSSDIAVSKTGCWTNHFMSHGSQAAKKMEKTTLGQLSFPRYSFSRMAWSASPDLQVASDD